MLVKLLHNSPLWVAAHSCRMSHDNHDKSDSQCYDDLYSDQREWIACGPKDRALIERVGNKLKHSSILEQLVYHFDIDGISRACLQELARHRTARLTVKSSRYTLNELKHVKPFENYLDIEQFAVPAGEPALDDLLLRSLENLRLAVTSGASNDKTKYLIPEAYKTHLMWQIDGRNLQNFLQLRTARDALPEIQLLGRAIFNALPADHQYLYIDRVSSQMATADASLMRIPNAAFEQQAVKR